MDLRKKIRLMAELDEKINRLRGPFRLESLKPEIRKKIDSLANKQGELFSPDFKFNAVLSASSLAKIIHEICLETINEERR